MDNKNVTHSSRIVIFDLLRIVLTVLVVNLHIRFIAYGKSNFLEQYVFYTVPLFMVLSFYFMSKYFIREKLNKQVILPRIKRILIPLLFWSVMAFAVHPELISVKNILLQILTGELINVPLYYLNLLIIFTIIFWIITYLPFRLRMIIYLVIILIAFYLQYSLINYHFFSPQIMALKNSYGRFVELIPYAVVGILFGLLVMKTKIKNLNLIILIVFFSLIYFITMKMSLLPGFHFSGIKIFSGTIVIFSITLFLSVIKFNQKTQSIIGLLGKYSFGVYLFHFILLEFLLKILSHLTVYIIEYSIIFTIIYTAFCYGLCIIFNILTRRKFAFLIE